MGDYFKLRLPWLVYVDMALELIKWFNNHSIALGILQSQQKAANKTVLVLIFPVITRWTSHYLAVSRLIDLGPFIRAAIETRYDTLFVAAGKRRDAKDRARRVLSYAQDSRLWKGLEL